jgi:UDP-N-acetylglucosamine diphosphorylase/glucosamine-1-phosphate N-acetyltransferase
LPVNPAVSTKDGVLLVNSRVLLFSGQTLWKPEWLATDCAGVTQGTIVWMHLTTEMAGRIDFSKLGDPRTLEAVLPEVQRHTSQNLLINRPWDILDQQKPAILEDFASLGRANEATLLPGAHVLAPENVFLGTGVKVWPGAVLDAQNGPIIIEPGTEIRANAVLTGPTSVGPQCVIRTAADIRENCSLGPGSRVGGEINNTIFLGNSSKQHYGYLGQTIVGEWVNIGAGATASNMKNTHGIVRMALQGKPESSGRQFLGSLIADHVKIGIGTLLSTGSVIGFASHVSMPRPAKFVPSFAWVTENGVERADFEKLEEIARGVMERRGMTFSQMDHELFVRIASDWAVGENYPWPHG